MFSNYEGNYNYWYDVSEIFARQEEVFYTFIGLYPSNKIRFKSPFRPDNKPGCRFEFLNGIWYLIDNATHKGRLSFNCINMVKELFECDFKAACRIIYFNLDKNMGSYEKVALEANKHIQIEFKVKDWTENNYFTSYGLPVGYLKNQPYYLVESYLTNSKTDKNLKLNRFYNPDVYPVIAYYFEDTNHTKLYFPGREMRFYSNCNNDDIFGWHRIGDYLFNREDTVLFITKSAKDEMILNYYFDVMSLALQGEVFKELPNKLMSIIKYFDKIVVNMDNDRVGHEANLKTKQLILNHYPQKNVNIMTTTEKDISEQIKLIL